MIDNVSRDIITSQMQIVNDVTGAWKSQVMYTLLKIGAYDLLEKEAHDINSLARELHMPLDSLKRLAECAVSLGYFVKNGTFYSNSALTSRVLVSGKAGFMGNWLLLCAKWYDSFGKLEQAIKTNQAVEDINLIDDQTYKDLFIKGMIDYAQYRGSDILKFLNLSAKRRLLDVGSGPSIYAAMFCENYPNLRVTCIDLPHAILIAKEYLADKKIKDQIDLVECDYKKANSFGKNYDVVFISHVLHQENEDICFQILKKGYQALNHGGLLIIQAMFPDEKGLNSYTLLHDLLSLLVFPGGKNYSVAETMDWLKNVGLKNVRYKKMSLFNINSLVIGEKI
jgi:predicted O-methyltransferase YrrM